MEGQAEVVGEGLRQEGRAQARFGEAGQREGRLNAGDHRQARVAPGEGPLHRLPGQRAGLDRPDGAVRGPPGAEAHRLGAQRRRAQAGLAGVDEQAEVDLAGAHPLEHPGAAVGVQLEGEAGCGLLQGTGEAAEEEGLRDGDAQRGPVGGPQQPVQRVEVRAGVAQQGAAGGAQAQAAAHALDEGQAQRALQRLDALGHGALGDAQAGGGPAGGAELVQRAQGLQAVPHAGAPGAAGPGPARAAIVVGSGLDGAPSGRRTMGRPPVRLGAGGRMHDLLWISLSFAAAALSATFGMAGGLLLLLGLGAGMPVAAAMGLHGLTQASANGARAALLSRHIAWGPALACAAGALLSGAVVGGLDLQPPPRLVWAACGASALLGLALEGRAGLRFERPRVALLAGLVTAAAQITAGVAGPLLDAFFVDAQLDRRAVVATKALTQVVAHLVKLGVWAPLGLAEPRLAAGMALAAVAGTFAGRGLLGRMSEAGFRRATRGLVLALGLASLLRAALG